MLPRELVHIGSFTVQTFGVTIAIGILAGLYIAYREAVRKRLDAEVMLDTALIAVLAGFVGSRLLYVLLHLGDYITDPLQVFRVEQGGLSLYGGLVLGLAAAYLVLRRRGLPILPALDAAAPGIVLAYAIGRIGCDIYGKVTNLPWAVWVNGEPHHPSQFYSVILGLAIFAFLWLRRKRVTFDGEMFTWYVALYGAGRFFIEFTRYSDAMVGPLTLTQAVTLPVAVAAFYILRRQGSRARLLEHRQAG